MLFSLHRILKLTVHQWNLVQVPGEIDVWTMTSVEDQSGVIYYKTDQTYWGYGYPYTKSGPSEKWSIIERTSEGNTFSKLVPVFMSAGLLI